jgi:hypothetical protein
MRVTILLDPNPPLKTPAPWSLTPFEPFAHALAVALPAEVALLMVPLAQAPAEGWVLWHGAAPAATRLAECALALRRTLPARTLLLRVSAHSALEQLEMGHWAGALDRQAWATWRSGATGWLYGQRLPCEWGGRASLRPGQRTARYGLYEGEVPLPALLAAYLRACQENALP